MDVNSKVIAALNSTIEQTGGSYAALNLEFGVRMISITLEIESEKSTGKRPSVELKARIHSMGVLAARLDRMEHYLSRSDIDDATRIVLLPYMELERASRDEFLTVVSQLLGH